MSGVVLLFLSGVTNDRIQDRLVASGCGILLQPGSGYVRRAGAFAAFAADNGCFSKGDSFDADGWLRWLSTVPRDGCLFAVAPDVVGNHVATVERSRPWLAEIRRLGLPAAFVGQNGATPANVPWGTFDVLFVGGSPECLPCTWVRPAHLVKLHHCPTCGRRLEEWKLGVAAAQLVREAKHRGLWVHMGRVNSGKRLRYADSIGVDSADGTYLAFAPDKNLPTLVGWLATVSPPTYPTEQGTAA